MTDNEFNEIIQRRIDLSLKLLTYKAKEYAIGDRLHNFKHAAQILRTTKEKAVLGFATKHLVSIIDLVEAKARGEKVSMLVWDEKIGDFFNYILLLDAAFQEEIAYERDPV